MTPVPSPWQRGARLAMGAVALVSALCGCAGLVPQTMQLRDSWPAGVPVRKDLAAVPFHPQQDYQCGPAALATTLNYSGSPVGPDELVGLVYLAARQGSLQADMLAAPRRLGRVSYKLAPSFADLLREVGAGNPVVVLQNNGIGFFDNWHYAVVVGFDYPAGELYLRSGTTRRLAIPFTVFEHTWRKSAYWAMVTPPPGSLPATAEEDPYAAAVAALDRVADGSGHVPAATVAYANLLERWPGNLAASVGLANRHYAGGRLAEAEAVLRAALARHPDAVVVLNNLAQTLAERGAEAEALQLVERALRLDDPVFATAVRETQSAIRQRRASSGEMKAGM